MEKVCFYGCVAGVADVGICTDGGWQSGVDAGKHDGAGILRYGDESDVCHRRDPRDRGSDPGVFDVDQGRRTNGPYCGNVVRGLYLPGGGSDGD